RVSVRTEGNEGMCGFGFKTGRDYLVYAFRDQRAAETMLETSICTRTQELPGADADIRELGKPETVFAKEEITGSDKDSMTPAGGMSDWTWVFIVVAAANIAFGLGVALGVIVGRKSKRRPLQDESEVP